MASYIMSRFPNNRINTMNTANSIEKKQNHNFNKLQGQGPPPGTTPKISKIRGWSLTRKNERPPFDNFYIRDHPPGTTPPNIKDQGWSLARKNERPPPLIISFQGPPPETTKLVPTCHHNAQ